MNAPGSSCKPRRWMISSRFNTWSTALVSAAWLLLCSASDAAPIFVDDFEAGAITQSSGGKWSGRTENPYVDVFAATDAKRRGAHGYRLRDGNGSTGDRLEGQAERTVPTTPNNYYMRYWFRLTSTNHPSSGASYLSQLCSSDCYEGYGDILIRSDRSVVLEAKTASTTNGGYVSDTSSTKVTVGTWYLFEVATRNLRNSSHGSTRLFINGQLAAERTGLNFSGKSVGLIVLGEPWAKGGTYTGNLDFDDVYVDDAPLPSHFRVEAPPSVATDDCVPLTFSLRDSLSAALAPAPYEVTGIPVGVSGTASALHSDSACTSATVSTVGFAENTEETTLYFRSTTTGTATVTVGDSTTDFLPGQTSFTVVLGTPPPAPTGSSCSSNSQCESTFCVDGVCCNSACNAGTCDACSVAQGALTNGVCHILPSGTLCRTASDDCDAEELCTGTSGVCPPSVLQPAGTVCRGAAGPCDFEEVCSGSSAACPADGVRAAGSVCRIAPEPCDVVESCDGTSKLCPADAFAPGTLVCSEATASGEATHCSGSAASCPASEGTGDPSGVGAFPSPDCETIDCIAPADVGCSCRSTGEAGLLALLSCVVLILRAQRSR